MGKNMHKHPIDGITGEEGFWTEHCRDTLIELYEVLVEVGDLSGDDAYDLCQRVYHAVSGEFVG